MADENALIIATNKFEAWRDAKTADLLAEAHKATNRRYHAGVAYFKARNKFVSGFTDRNRQRLIDAETTFQAGAAAEADAIEKLQQARAKLTFEIWEQEQKQKEQE